MSRYSLGLRLGLAAAAIVAIARIAVFLFAPPGAGHTAGVSAPAAADSAVVKSTLVNQREARPIAGVAKTAPGAQIPFP